MASDEGGLCGNEEFEKALDDLQLDTDHNNAGSLCIEMLVPGELGRNNAGRRAARASSSSSGPSGARSSTSSSPGQVRIRAAPCMHAEAPAHVAHPTRQVASAGGAPRPGGAAKRKAITSRSSDHHPHPSLDGSVNAAACRIHVFQLICLAAQLRPTNRSAGFAGGAWRTPRRTPRRPRRRWREGRRRRRRNPTCLYSSQFHESI